MRISYLRSHVKTVRCGICLVAVKPEFILVSLKLRDQSCFITVIESFNFPVVFLLLYENGICVVRDLWQFPRFENVKDSHTFPPTISSSCNLPCHIYKIQR